MQAAAAAAARATPAAPVGRAVRWMPALLLLVLCGCAYFNTFYNAKKQFGKAEEERQGATARPGEIPAAATTATGAQVLGPGADSYQSASTSASSCSATTPRASTWTTPST